MNRNALALRLNILIALAAALLLVGPPGLRAQSMQSHIASVPAARGIGTAVEIERPRHIDADSIEIDLPIPGVEAPIVLHRYSMRSADFKVIEYLDATTSAEFDAPPPNTFRGKIPTLPGSDLGLNLTPDGIRGMFFDGAGGTWFIEPESFPAERRTIAPGDWHRAHRIYRSADVPDFPNVRCGVSPTIDARFAPDPTVPPCESSGVGTPRGGATLSVCEIALDADYPFFQRAGGTTTAVVIDIEGLMLAIQMIYERDTGIAYSITSIVVRATPPADPYNSTDSYALLCQFRNHWNNVLGATPRDITHLMTGRQLDGSIVGLAWLGVVCNSAGSSNIQGCTNFDSLGYGLSESLFTTNYANRINLTAHELGHNWNACHCDQGGCTGSGPDPDCGIMWSIITGSTTFGSRSISSIVDHRNSRTCLDVIPIPEDDGYEENDSLAQSVPLPFGTTNLVMADAADYFSFTFCETGSITVSAEYEPPLNIRLTILTSGGITLSTVTGTSGFASVTRNLAPGGYRVLVQRTTGHYGPYTMTVTGPADCNGNSKQDRCDILNGTSTDCDSNGTPDECDILTTDCNANGIPDDCDIAASTADDCNSNGIPDSCDLAAETSADCNDNAIPDECETDCNANGIPDDCDIAASTADDCNNNGIPDSCDLAAETSADCNDNAIPDECETDCNANGIPDDCDIAASTADDCNSNGVLDICEKGDFDSSGVIDLADLVGFVDALLDPLAPCSLLSDLNSDDRVDSTDIQPFIDILLAS